MPNRILKESICASENLAGLTPRAEVFFYRLIVNCDDYGRMDARTAILRSKCFPLVMEAVSIRDIEDWLQELARAELIRCYRWGDRPYLELVTWGKHQKIRAQRSKYPGPDGDETMTDTAADICGRMSTDADVSARNPNRDPNPNPNLNPDPKRHPHPKAKSKATAKPSAKKVQVTLSPEEREKLVGRYGELMTERMIGTLLAYKKRSGRVYRSDYRAILNWTAKKVLAEATGPEQKGGDSHGAGAEHSAKPFGFDRERFLWRG